MSVIILCIILQVNGVGKGSSSVPSEMCDSVNREAVKVDLEQDMLCNSDMSSTKIYVAPHGRVINFAK